MITATRPDDPPIMLPYRTSHRPDRVSVRPRAGLVSEPRAAARACAATAKTAVGSKPGAEVPATSTMSASSAGAAAFISSTSSAAPSTTSPGPSSSALAGAPSRSSARRTPSARWLLSSASSAASSSSNPSRP